jgi:MFS superfamily sulfate permease-like transporter
MVPMACIGGILLFVAVNMVKPAEVREVWNHNRFHAGMMVYTAVMVPLTDFLIGVLSALALYGVLYRFLDEPPVAEPRLVEQPSDAARRRAADLANDRQPMKRQAS